MLLPLLLLLAAPRLVSACVDESGEAVDWFVAFKAPNGESYAGLSRGSRSLTTHPSLTKGAVGNTLNALYGGGATSGYVMYNDEPPDEHCGGSAKSCSAAWAHQKGVVYAAPGGAGGWLLVHSVPRFPAAPPEKHFEYPSNERIYGQSFLCLSLSQAMLDEVGGLLAVSRPFVYASSLPGSLATDMPRLAKAAQNPKASATTSSVKTLRTKGGASFSALMKGHLWGKDLYEELVAPQVLELAEEGSSLPFDS